MKTFLTTSGRLIGLSVAALLAIAAPVTNGFSQPASPVGQWDCVMTGNGQNGIIFLNFMSEVDAATGLPAFEGVFVQGGHRRNPTGRQGSTGTGRTGNSTIGSFTNIFGGGFIQGAASDSTVPSLGSDDWFPDSRGLRGTWFFNSKGRVVGAYFTVLDATAHVTNYFQTCIDEPLQINEGNGTNLAIQINFCFTNPVIVTNIAWNDPRNGAFGFTNLAFTNENFTIGAVGITNNVSFIGKVVPGKRLTMVGNSAFGKFTIRGVPLAPVQTALPVDGFFWTGMKFANGFKMVEEFKLVDTAIPNVYGMNGQGPSYTYDPLGSICLISQQKRIGFSVFEIPTGADTNAELTAALRGTVGGFVNTTKSIGTKGLGCYTGDPNVIEFDASLSPYALP